MTAGRFHFSPGRDARRPATGWKPAPLLWGFALAVVLCVAGCGRAPQATALTAREWRVWSVPPDGATLPTPRSVALGNDGEIAALDTAGRVLIYDDDGALKRQWQMLDVRVGKPEGIVVLRDGRVVVCDTHYHRVVWFDAQGAWLKNTGAHGRKDGEFIYPVGICTDAAENLYVCEYGGNDRVQKFSREGQWLASFGSFGTGPGQFQRPSGLTWKDGRSLLRERLPPGMPLDDFIASISMAGTLEEQHKLHRSQGAAIFLVGNPNGTPNALIKNIKHNQILHRQNILLTIVSDSGRPYVPPAERVEVSDRTEGFFRVIASFGFMENPNINEVIRAAGEKGLVIHRDKTTFFVGKERIMVTAKAGMAIWREHLFAFLSKNAENAADFFQLPPDRVYEVSQVVEI